jgi:hypothetical protein
MGKLAEVEGAAVGSFSRRWGGYPMVEGCHWQWDLALGSARFGFQQFTGPVQLV